MESLLTSPKKQGKKEVIRAAFLFFARVSKKKCAPRRAYARTPFVLREFWTFNGQWRCFELVGFHLRIAQSRAETNLVKGSPILHNEWKRFQEAQGR